MLTKRVLLAGLLGLALTLPASADEKGTATLKAAYKKLHEAKTLTFDLAITMAGPMGPIQWTGTARAMKPNFARIELKGNFAQSFYADGKDYFMLANSRATKLPLEAKPKELQGVWEGELDAFFGGEELLGKLTATFVEDKKVDGVDCVVVKAVMKSPDRTAIYTIGVADSMIRQMTLLVTTPEGEREVQSSKLSNVKLNGELKAADFAYTGPKPVERPSPAAGLLPVGQSAPDFILPLPGAGNLGLTEARKGKKAVLINFWFYG